MIKPKMRIAFLDKDLTKLNDRLVTQDIELKNGPQEKHKGAIMLEATLTSQEDIKAFTDYLERLRNDLPLPEKKVYKTGPKSISLLDKEPLREMLEEAERKSKTLDDLIKYLRERNFQFVTDQWLSDMEFKTEIKNDKRDFSNYQFMIRCIKEAKNPLNNKYDPQLVIGFRYAPIKEPNARIFMYDKFLRTIKLGWAEKSDINFKKIKLKKFPPYMVQEERDRYRMEEAKYKAKPEAEKSKFWNRWNPAVEEFNK